MNKVIAILLLAFGVACFAKTAPDPKPQLVAMLNNFLAAASHAPPSAADKNTFEQFFADDVIYTRAAGLVISKADIMHSLDEPPSPSGQRVSHGGLIYSDGTPKPGYYAFKNG